MDKGQDGRPSSLIVLYRPQTGDSGLLRKFGAQGATVRQGLPTEPPDGTVSLPVNRGSSGSVSGQRQSPPEPGPSKYRIFIKTRLLEEGRGDLGGAGCPKGPWPLFFDQTKFVCLSNPRPPPPRHKYKRRR